MAAATALRHGFIENGYIAEILCGMPRPLPLAIWHGSNLAEPEYAEDYVEMFRAAVAPDIRGCGIPEVAAHEFAGDGGASGNSPMQEMTIWSLILRGDARFSIKKSA